MAQRTARIRSQGTMGTVEVNDHDLSEATGGYTLVHKAGSIAELTLDLVIHDTDIDGKMHVRIPPQTEAALVALGWTPPPKDERPDQDDEHQGRSEPDREDQDRPRPKIF